MTVTLAQLIGAPPRPFVARAAAVQGGAAAAGLVDNSTSDTSPVVRAFDRDVMRLRRMKRRVTKAADVHTSGDLYGLRPAMVTLTYADRGAWAPRHLSNALNGCRQWLARRGHKLRYTWVAELQARGAVHYHVLAWLPYGEDKPPFWDVQGWWPHGSSQSAWARNPVAYMVKYASKVGSKDRLPMGARMHGSGGFSKAQRADMSWHSRPKWLRDLTSALQAVRRNVAGVHPGTERGGWIQRFACGLAKHIPSPFELLARGRTVFVARKGSDPETVRTEYSAQWLSLFQPA